MTINRIGAPSAGTIGAHAAPTAAPASAPAAGATARPARAAVTGPLARLAPPAVRTGNTGGAGAAPRQLRPPPGATPAPSGHGNDMAAMQASALATMAAQNALAQIQNQIAVNQSKNAVIEELGKGLKSLSQ
jgi:hypothetical protein